MNQNPVFSCITKYEDMAGICMHCNRIIKIPNFKVTLEMDSGDLMEPDGAYDPEMLADDMKYNVVHANRIDPLYGFGLNRHLINFGCTKCGHKDIFVVPERLAKLMVDLISIDVMPSGYSVESYTMPSGDVVTLDLIQVHQSLDEELVGILSEFFTVENNGEWVLSPSEGTMFKPYHQAAFHKAIVYTPMRSRMGRQIRAGLHHGKLRQAELVHTIEQLRHPLEEADRLYDKQIAHDKKMAEEYKE